MDQVSENSIINVAKSNNYHYVGTLKTDPNTPSRMIANFPLSEYTTCSKYYIGTIIIS